MGERVPDGGALCCCQPPSVWWRRRPRPRGSRRGRCRGVAPRPGVGGRAKRAFRSARRRRVRRAGAGRPGPAAAATAAAAAWRQRPQAGAAGRGRACCREPGARAPRRAPYARAPPRRPPRFPFAGPAGTILCGPRPPPASLDEGEGGGGLGRKGAKAGARAGGAIVGPRARLTDVGENAPAPLCAQGQPGMFPPQDFSCELAFYTPSAPPPGRSRRAREGEAAAPTSRVRRGICGSKCAHWWKSACFSLSYLEAKKSDRGDWSRLGNRLKLYWEGRVGRARLELEMLGREGLRWTFSLRKMLSHEEPPTGLAGGRLPQARV